MREAPRPGFSRLLPEEEVVASKLPRAEIVAAEEPVPVKIGVVTERFPATVRLPLPLPSIPPEKFADVDLKPPITEAPDPRVSTSPEIESDPPEAVGKPAGPGAPFALSSLILTA